MRNFICLQLLVAATLTANAQPSTPQIKSDEVERAVFRTKGALVQEFDGRKQGVVGSPYIFADWPIGTITLSDSQQVSIDWVYNINGETGQLAAKNIKDGTLKGIFYNDIIEIKLLDGIQTRTFRPIMLTNTYLMCEVLFDGPNFKLYKLNGKKFMKADYVERGVVGVGRINDEYVIEDSYWADMGKKSYLKLQATAKKLPDSIPTKKTIIAKYIADKKLKGKLTANELYNIFLFLDDKAAAKQ